MDIIKANKVLWHVYGLLLKGTFNNKEVDDLLGELCKRVSLKEAAKAQFATAVAIKAFTQVEDDVINKEEGELDKQYVAIEINYKTEVIGEE